MPTRPSRRLTLSRGLALHLHTRAGLVRLQVAQRGTSPYVSLRIDAPEGVLLEIVEMPDPEPTIVAEPPWR